MTRLRYLLDTDVCIALQRTASPNLAARVGRQSMGAVGVSVVTAGELQFGAWNSAHAAENRSVLARVFESLVVVAMTADVADHYGEIRAWLQRKGKPIGGNDLWIAAHARCLGVMLVSANQREFSRVPGLRSEDWSRPAR